MPPAMSTLVGRARDLCEESDQLRVQGRRVHFEGERASKTRRVQGEGTAQLAYLFELLDSFGMKRSNVQKQLHLGMVGDRTARAPTALMWRRRIGSVMQRIFCSDSDADMKLAMARHKIPSSRQQFMAITPRRFGCVYVHSSARPLFAHRYAASLFRDIARYACVRLSNVLQEDDCGVYVRGSVRARCAGFADSHLLYWPPRE